VALADPALAEEHGAWTGQLDGGPDDGHQRTEQRQTNDGARHVKRAASCCDPGGPVGPAQLA